MYYAILFSSENKELVSAQDVYDGKYNRHDEFVDAEEGFKVIYVGGAKNHGKPHFRLYLSLEDYNNLSPEKRSRFDIISNMRKYSETAWHMEWKNKFSGFADIEKHIKNEKTKKYKFADALYQDAKTCIEFQHSFIDWDFEERNKFHKELGYKTIWLYDLTKCQVKLTDNNSYQILEDNSNGFFRIAENPSNLKENNVFIQVKDYCIYWVDKLERKEIDHELKSTIRYFKPKGIYESGEFVSKIRNKGFDFMADKKDDTELKTLFELWNKSYTSLLVENTNTKQQVIVYRDFNNQDKIWMKDSNIVIKFITWNNKTQKYKKNSDKEYYLYQSEANKRIWKYLGAFCDTIDDVY